MEQNKQYRIKLETEIRRTAYYTGDFETLVAMFKPRLIECKQHDNFINTEPNTPSEFLYSLKKMFRLVPLANGYATDVSMEGE